MDFSYTYLAPSPVNLTIILLDYFLFLLIYILYIFNINLLSATHVRNIFPQSHICPFIFAYGVFFPGPEKFFFNYITKSNHIMTVPAEYLERVSRHGAEKGNPGRSWQCFWVEVTELGVQGGQRIREGRAAQRETSRDLQPVPCENSVEYWSIHVCEETTWGQGKNQPKGLEWAVPRAHTGLRVVCLQQLD